jgi:hypothetical protein
MKAVNGRVSDCAICSHVTASSVAKGKLLGLHVAPSALPHYSHGSASRGTGTTRKFSVTVGRNYPAESVC